MRTDWTTSAGNLARKGLAALAKVFGLASKRARGCLTVAIVGEFQRGKSTLANALLGRRAAKRGRGLATTHANQSFSLTPRMVLVDTPGFNANETDTVKALKALETADVFLYVHESKALGETCAELFRMAREKGKTVLFLLNCLNRGKWAPEENGDIVATIESELANKGLADSFMMLAGRRVTPINALWGCFGKGMPDAKSEDGRRTLKNIRQYADDDLSIPGAKTMPTDTLRAEMARRSGVPEVREWLLDLPVSKLRDLVGRPEQSLERILDRMAAELREKEVAS